MKHLLLLIPLLTSCSTLAPILGGATGAAAGSLAGPAGAAVGAGAGVAAAQMVFPNQTVEDDVALEAVKSGQPVPGTTASTIHEATSFIHGIGWWYLLIFVLAPFLTRKGRTWVRKFTELGNTVSQKDIEERSLHQDERLNNLEDHVNSLLNNKKQ